MATSYSSPLKENVHPQYEITSDQEKNVKGMIENLQTTVNGLQTKIDVLAIELKQVLADITKSNKKKDELLDKMQEEIKCIRHKCRDNSSQSSTSPEK